MSLTSATLSGTSWYELSPLASGAVVSGSLGGALLASALALVFGDTLGRRNELLLGAGCYGAGALLMGGANGLAALLLGRLVYGLGIGFTMHGAPIYIAETAPTQLRGTLISLKEAFIVGGILLGFLASSVLISDEGGWRVILALGALPALATAVGVTSLLPESPRHLLQRGGGTVRARGEATAALTRLRGSVAPAAVAAELDQMAKVAEAQAALSAQVGFRNLPFLPCQ